MLSIITGHSQPRFDCQLFPSHPSFESLEAFHENGYKEILRLDHYLLITGFINQAQAIAKAAINDKTNIVMPSKILCFANSLGIFLGNAGSKAVSPVSSYKYHTLPGKKPLRQSAYPQ